MIVCICNNVNCKTINAAIENGAESLHAVKRCTNAGTCCGSCEFKIQQMIANHQSDKVIDVLAKPVMARKSTEVA